MRCLLLMILAGAGAWADDASEKLTSGRREAFKCIAEGNAHWLRLGHPAGPVDHVHRGLPIEPIAGLIDPITERFVIEWNQEIRRGLADGRIRPKPTLVELCDDLARRLPGPDAKIVRVEDGDYWIDYASGRDKRYIGTRFLAWDEQDGASRAVAILEVQHSFDSRAAPVRVVRRLRDTPIVKGTPAANPFLYRGKRPRVHFAGGACPRQRRIHAVSKLDAAVDVVVLGSPPLRYGKLETVADAVAFDRRLRRERTDLFVETSNRAKAAGALLVLERVAKELYSR